MSVTLRQLRRLLDMVLVAFAPVMLMTFGFLFWLPSRVWVNLFDKEIVALALFLLVLFLPFYAITLFAPPSQTSSRDAPTTHS